MIKMVVFDVDGTLYDCVNHEIPLSAIQAIHKMKEKGILFVIATGRAHYGLGKALNDLQPDYILSINGGCLVDRCHHILHAHTFNLEEVQSLIDFCHQNQAGLLWKFPQHMYIYQYPEKIDWIEGQMRSDIGTEPFIHCPSQDHHLIESPMACCIHANSKKVQEFQKNHQTIDFIQYSEQGYDVVPKGINKGVGLSDLMNYLNLSSNEVICIGDNYNDLEMMKKVDFSIAMGNAVDEVKKWASYTTLASSENGIAHALQYLKII